MKHVCCDSANNIPSHDAELKRLKRIAGQLEGIRRMIEEQRYCPDILTQIRAARSALHALEGNILEAHLKSCVADAFTRGSKKEKQEKIEELKELFRRFD